MLTNRLKKRYKILSKWAKGSGISAYRLYDKDIPEYPLVIDIYGDFAAVWLYPRDEEESESLSADVLEALPDATSIVEDNIVIKQQKRQLGNKQKDISWKKTDRNFVVEEQGLRFEIDLHNYLDTGLFLDHRNTRSMVKGLAEGKDVLNLYAYTGSFTSYSVCGGAKSTTTVDLNNKYTEWAKRNLELNGFAESDDHQFIVSDVISFLKNADQDGHKYDLIICDPPSFSNTKDRKINTFVVDKGYVDLLHLCFKVLKPDGKLFFSTNSRKFKLDEINFDYKYQFENISEKTVPFDFRNKGIHKCWKVTVKDY
jgi:23S rRNA (cytosine1962-C5)-methyltransferase